MLRGGPSPLPGGGRRLLPVTPRRSGGVLGQQQQSPLQVAGEIAAKSRSSPAERGMENNNVHSDHLTKSPDPPNPDNVDIRSQTKDISDFHEEQLLLDVARKKTPDKLSRSSSRQDNSVMSGSHVPGPRPSVRKALSLDYVKSLQRKTSMTSITEQNVPHKTIVISSTQAFSKNAAVENGAFFHIDHIRTDTLKNVPKAQKLVCNIIAHEPCEGDVSAYPALSLETGYSYGSDSLAALQCENIDELTLEDIENLDLKINQYNAGNHKELAEMLTRWANPVEGSTEKDLKELQHRKKVLEWISRKLDAQKRAMETHTVEELDCTEQGLMRENQWQKEVENIIRRFEAQKRKIRRHGMKDSYSTDEELLEYEQKQKERELIIRRLETLKRDMKRNEVTDFYNADGELMQDEQWHKEMEELCVKLENQEGYINSSDIEDSYSADEDLIEEGPWEVEAENIRFEAQERVMNAVDDLYIADEELIEDELTVNERKVVIGKLDTIKIKDMKGYEMDNLYSTDNLLQVKQSQRDIEKMCRRLEAQRRDMRGHEVKEVNCREQKLLKDNEWQNEVEKMSASSEAEERERKRQEVNKFYVTEKELLTIGQRQKAREQIIRKLESTKTGNKNGLGVEDLNFTDQELMEYEQWQNDVETMGRRLEAQKRDMNRPDMRELYKQPIRKTDTVLPIHRVVKGVVASPSGNRLVWGLDYLETSSCSPVDERQCTLPRPDILSHLDGLINAAEHDELHMLKLNDIEFE